MKLLIVGKNSFISNSLCGDRISFSDIDNINLKNYDAIINCSLHPKFKEQSYIEKYDIDYLVAQIAQKNKKHYLMISSRKVYGSTNELKIFDETSKTNPNCFYGENKLLAEKKITSLSDSTCILRCSNVYGMETNRKSFFSFCIDQLLNKTQIIYEIGEKTKRDFLPVECLNQIIQKILLKKSKGVFNVGSNYGLEIGEVARLLIKGYGQGNFITLSSEVKDQFILNNQKVKKELNIEIDVDFNQHIKNIGKKLCKTL
jgi:nucleoside-diphosphate-sugar epimerase